MSDDKPKSGIGGAIIMGASGLLERL